MKEFFFTISPEEGGSFSAYWNDPQGGGISTQGKDLAHLEVMVQEAMECHFDEKELPIEGRIKIKRQKE